MRVLFALGYPGFLRYFDTTIRLLAERGHEVELWFDQPGKQQEALDAFPPHPRVIVKGALPKRRDPWGGTAYGVRGVTDIIRYFDPRFSQAVYLRRRAVRKVPRAWQSIGRIPSLPTRLVNALLTLCRTVEAAVPRAPAFDRLIVERSPDVVICAPLVMWRSRQADLVRSAVALGVPSAALIASWDNLTTKGLLRVLPDRVVVWNELQADEAEQLHAVPRSRVVVTGAQPFDKWFGRRPTRDRAVFCARVGLPTDEPFVLFVGSTASISAPEAEREFVRRWVRALRASPDRELAQLPVLVRPHPYNSAHWELSDVAEFGRATVYPVGGANPVDEDDRTDYFDSLYHSAAVVGINTSAMVEAAIIGRPVLTITADEFNDTQMGTLHFRYLLPDGGGCVQAAQTLDEHLAQLAGTLRDPQEAAARIESFVSTFVRPRGLDRLVTPILADTIEEVAQLRVEPQPNRVSFVPRLLIQAMLVLGPARWAIATVRKRAAWKLEHRRRRGAAPVEPTGPLVQKGQRVGDTRAEDGRILRRVRARRRAVASRR